MEHGGEHHLLNFVRFIRFLTEDQAFWVFLEKHVNIVFSLLATFVIVGTVSVCLRRPSLVPSGPQFVVEAVHGGIDRFVRGILGPQGGRHVPLIGTLFIYIWVMNMMGIVPLMHSSTTSLNTTVALALVVFFYVQVLAVRNFGILGYLDHLMGSPRNLMGAAMVPLMLVIHLIGELAKPLSLSLRLACNITGEDTLIAVFVDFGVRTLAFLPLPIGVPYQIPFIFLSLLLGTIQALVFPLLTTVYIAMVSHHGE